MFHLDDNRTASQAQGACSNDYVRSWLEKTQRRPAWEPMTEGPQDTNVPWRPHDLEAVDTGIVPQRSFSQKRRRESPDSSIIPDRHRRGDHRSFRPGTSNRHAPPRQCHGRDARTRPQSSDAMSPIPSRREPGRFERRARHKTRPDRYEAKRRVPAQVAEDRQKPRRTKTQAKKKLVSSREVMDSFTSDAILTQGRLTVKPAPTPGLYGNARCGSPNEMPDLAYNSMGFLARTKRRDDPPEQSDKEVRENCEKRRTMRGSSPLLLQRSESRASSEDSRYRNMTESHVWRRSDKNSPAPIRPNTAPTDIETMYEPLERKPRYKPGRNPSSVETEYNPVRGSSPFRDAVSPPGDPGSHDTPNSESMSRQLWHSGGFGGMERIRTSSPDNRRSNRRRMEEVSPRHQKKETRVENYSKAQCAETLTMAMPDGVTDNQKFSTGPYAAPIPVQADSSRKVEKPGVQDDVSRAPGASPHRTRCHALPATRPGAHTAQCATPVDRTKIAFMAHIPVYSHQECQTEFPCPPLQPVNYTEAGTQTEVPPTPEHCQQYQTPTNAPYSPHQQHDAPRDHLPEEPLADDRNPRWVLDERYYPMLRNSRPDAHEELMLALSAEYPRAHPDLLEQMALEIQRSRCAGHGELEETASCHRDVHDAPVLDLVEPMESETIDEEGCSYPWEYEGHPLDGQVAAFETVGNGSGPIYRHVDQETRSYRPYPIRYRTDTAAALQPLTRGVPAGNAMTAGITREEPFVYPRNILYPSEQQPPKRPRSGIRSPIEKDVPPCVHSMAGYTQDENRVNIRRPSHFPAHQRQAVLDDLEKERAEAYWWSKQLEFPRRYGY